MPHNTMPQPEVLNNHIQIGGRKLKLAVVQLEIVKAQIEAKHPHLQCDILALLTLGDKVQLQPLYLFGGKLLWTKELETLLLEAVGDYPKLDMIVHLLKDMPTNLPDEFELGCILEREDPRDAVVMAQGSLYTCLAELPAGAVVGTLLIRRSAQLARRFPQLTFKDVRGNIFTRLGKLDAPNLPYHCLVLALAGLVRLGLEERITCALDAPDMYYAVGQGALGVEIRKNDAVMAQVLGRLEHTPSTLCCVAERALMRRLEGGCLVPLGVHTRYDDETKTLAFKSIIVSPAGDRCVEGEITATVDNKAEAEAAGERLAQIMVEKGGKAILDGINFDKINQRPVRS